MSYDPDDLMGKGRERRTNGEGVKKAAHGGHMTAEERHNLPSSDFALPGERYPINDKAHARNALARVSQFGSSSEKSRVRSKVHSKYPEIGEDD